jgi:chromatin remodeling complex protein RSC6
MEQEQKQDETDRKVIKLENQLNTILEREVYTEEEIIKQEQDLAKLKKKVDKLMCELEVEHFLLAGPMGADPE